MLTRTSRHVRLAPESRRIAVIAKPPLRATSALMQRSNEVLFDHLVGACKHDFTQSSADPQKGSEDDVFAQRPEIGD